MIGYLGCCCKRECMREWVYRYCSGGAKRFLWLWLGGERNGDMMVLMMSRGVE